MIEFTAFKLKQLLASKNNEIDTARKLGTTLLYLCLLLHYFTCLWIIQGLYDPTSSVYVDVDEWYYSTEFYHPTPTNIEEMESMLQNARIGKHDIEIITRFYWTYFLFVSSTLTTVGYGDLYG